MLVGGGVEAQGQMWEVGPFRVVREGTAFEVFRAGGLVASFDVRTMVQSPVESLWVRSVDPLPEGGVLLQFYTRYRWNEPRQTLACVVDELRDPWCVHGRFAWVKPAGEGQLLVVGMEDGEVRVYGRDRRRFLRIGPMGSRVDVIPVEEGVMVYGWFAGENRTRLVGVDLSFRVCRDTTFPGRIRVRMDGERIGLITEEGKRLGVMSREDFWTPSSR